MPTYVALLRGVNVSGHKQIKMEPLRELFRNLDFGDVQTYVQSGNVIFKSSSTSVSAITTKVEIGIQREFGHTVPVLIIAATNLRGVFRNNPFLNEKGIDNSKLHVTFLSRAPSKSNLMKLSAIKTNGDSHRCVGDVVYLYCLGGYGRTKLSNNAIEKFLEVEATTRNWRTVGKLCGLLEKLESRG